MVTIVRAVQTCCGCPSQWDAWTDEGDYVYLRFRFGYGYADLYLSDTADSNAPRTRVGEFSDDDPYAGVIGLEEFCRRAGLFLAPAAAEEVA